MPNTMAPTSCHASPRMAASATSTAPPASAAVAPRPCVQALASSSRASCADGIAVMVRESSGWPEHMLRSGRAGSRLSFVRFPASDVRMIISHQHRFVFAAIPKTGTHSVRQALREHLSAEDLEQVGLFVNKRFPFEELASIKHGHITLEQIRPFLGEEQFASYLKFAFVRNPFDRFVSYCAFMTRATDAFNRNPQGVMRHILFEVRPLQHILFVPQHTFVTDT